jgi:hypothetical protein
MDNQSIEQCKYLLLARCSRLEYNLDNAHPRYAEKYADKLLNLTPREAFSGSDFDKLELFLDQYCMALYVENYEWARKAIKGIETLASESTECICLF